jgi:hypothetical protein
MIILCSLNKAAAVLIIKPMSFYLIKVDNCRSSLFLVPVLNVRQVLEAQPADGGTGGSAALRSHLAVIRWCLFGCGAVRDVLEMEGVPGVLSAMLTRY